MNACCICETSNVRWTKETRNLCVRALFSGWIYICCSFSLHRQSKFFSASSSSSLVRLWLLHWQHCTYIQCALFFSSIFSMENLPRVCFYDVLWMCVYGVVYGANFLTNSWSPFERKRCTNLYHAIIVYTDFVHLSSTHTCSHTKLLLCMPMVFFHRHVSYTHFFLFAHSLNWLFSRIWLAFAYIIFLNISCCCCSFLSGVRVTQIQNNEWASVKSLYKCHFIHNFHSYFFEVECEKPNE